MCISPSHVWVQRGAEWEKVPKPCGDCWRCRENYISDYTGRCLAEAATSEAACVLNMTYAPREDLADKVLYPRHFQDFIRALRKRGHKVRYLVAGEYGELKGRAHFHAILFFKVLKARPVKRPVPFYNWDHIQEPETSGPFCREVPHNEMCHISEWPHGHVTCDWDFRDKAVRYCVEYLRKDRENSWFSVSKKPPLGAEWFAQKAAIARELGVLPSKFEYAPPGAEPGKRYLMTGATRRDYLAACKPELHSTDRMSEWVLKTFEKHKLAAWRKRLDELPLSEKEAAFEEQLQELQERRNARQLNRIYNRLVTAERAMAELGGPVRWYEPPLVRRGGLVFQPKGYWRLAD